MSGELLRVYRDGRIEGALMLRPEMLRVPKRTPRPTDCVVAGGCYDTVCDLPVPLVLPVAGQVAAHAG